jgi:plasmid maintenance system killer protein
MKANRFVTVLSIVNAIVLLFMAASPQRDSFEKITVKEFELVDSSGKPRASIKVEEDGEIVFRMRDAQGAIRVKMGAGENGSGLVLLDGDTNPGVHVLSKKTGSSITVLGSGGKKKEF